MSFKTPFKHNLTTVSTIYKVYYKVLYKYLYKRILQEYLQDTTTNNPTKFSTTHATTYTTTGSYNLLLILDYCRSVTSNDVYSTITTVHSMLYSRGY